jgi:hypothetical protein
MSVSLRDKGEGLARPHTGVMSLSKLTLEQRFWVLVALSVVASGLAGWAVFAALMR